MLGRTNQAWIKFPNCKKSSNKPNTSLWIKRKKQNNCWRNWKKKKILVKICVSNIGNWNRVWKKLKENVRKYLLKIDSWKDKMEPSRNIWRDNWKIWLEWENNWLRQQIINSTSTQHLPKLPPKWKLESKNLRKK